MQSNLGQGDLRQESLSLKASLSACRPDHKMAGILDEGQIMSTTWATEMKTTSIGEPARLVPTLTGAILGCGGWVLSRSCNDTGKVTILFEFERQACVDIYSVLAAGVELSRGDHIWFTELYQCTFDNRQDCGTEIASIELEIQTSTTKTANASQASAAM